MPDQLFNEVVPFLLVFLRLSGLFVFAPILASTAIPGKARVLLACSLTLALYPLLRADSLAGPRVVAQLVDADVFTFVWVAVMEVALGTIIGFIAMLPVVAVQLAAVIMGQQMGMSLAAIYNPALETESDLLGELLMYLALGAFIMMGGLEALFTCLAASFHRAPLGGVQPSAMPLQLVVGAVSSGFELAIRLTTPLMALILIETVASAMVMKTMPQLNIMSLGFGLKIVLGLLALIVGLVAVEAAISDHIGDVLRALWAWAASRA